MLPGIPSAPAAYDEAQAYIPLRGGKLTAVALTDGHTNWTVDAPTTLRPATGQMLVFVASEKTLLALNVADGHERWRVGLEGSATVAPLFDTGWLFVGTDDGHLVALRAIDGQILWRLDAGAGLSASPAPSGNNIYVPLRDGRIIAADRRTGTALWTRKLPGFPAEMLALDDRLFVGSNDNFLYCLNASDGEIMWRSRTGADVASTPVVDEHRVYFVSLDNMLRALNRKNGVQQWKKALPFRPLWSPLKAADTVMVAGIAGQLRAFFLKDGAPAGDPPVPGSGELAAPLHAFETTATFGPTVTTIMFTLATGASVKALSRSVDPPVVTTLTPLPGVVPVTALTRR